MKLFRIAVAAALAMFYGNAYAFHSGGVAECEGCHSMHNSFEGSANVAGMPQYSSGPYLLKASDQSGACLNCHASADTAPTGYHIATLNVTPNDSTSPVEMTPGGDFAWLRKTTNITVRGNTAVNGNEGDRHGHNIIARDFGYTADKTQLTAPGGSYPASALACSSCHDPHGRYRRLADGTVSTTGLPIFGSGSYAATPNATQGGPAYPAAGVSAAGVYRILGGNGYQPKSLSGSYAFVANPPIALAPSSYNGANTTIAGTFDRVAYGAGMSEWCANCHTAMHLDTYTSGTSGLVHPAGNGAKFANAAIVSNYANYVSSGVMTGGTPMGGYSSLAPFEYGSAGASITDLTALATFRGAPTAPTSAQNVMCLSCHRAHASGFESMTRFFVNNEFMTIADAAGNAIYDPSTTENKINFGYTQAQQQNAYNGRPATLFGPYARDYCNKCHAKD